MNQAVRLSTDEAGGSLGSPRNPAHQDADDPISLVGASLLAKAVCLPSKSLTRRFATKPTNISVGKAFLPLRIFLFVPSTRVFGIATEHDFNVSLIAPIFVRPSVFTQGEGGAPANNVH